MARLREFQSDDLEALHALDAICFPAKIAYTRAEMRAFLRRGGSFCLVAERDAEGAAAFADTAENAGIVGFLIGETVSVRDKRAGYIVTIDVDPSARQQGIGRLLMQAAEARFRAAGAVSLHLEVAVDNASALGFYEQLGFDRVGRIPDYYPDGGDAFAMEKAL